MLTMIHTKMLLIPHVHQPIVAPPAVRVDDAVKGYLAPDRSLSPPDQKYFFKSIFNAASAR